MESEITASSTFPGVGPGEASSEHARSVAEPASLLGTTVGAYVVERVLGEGSTSTVYLAKHARLGTPVAIKVSDSDQVATQLEAEARATVAIDNRHVVRALDIGELPDGRQFAVMTYARGRPISTVLAVEGPLTVGEARAVLQQTAEAMVAAHAAGILHRDLKPANLLLDSKAGGIGFVHVLDLGSSKLLGATDADPGGGESLVGTPAYCAPEQIRGGRVGVAADIYALGAIAHELLRGKPLWAGAAEEVIARKLVEDAVAIGRADVPPALESLIMQMVSREADERPESMEEVLARLDAAVPSEAVTRAQSTRVTRLAVVAGAVAGAITVGALIAAMLPTGGDARASSMTRASAGTVEPRRPAPRAETVPVHDGRDRDIPPPPREVEPVSASVSATAPPPIAKPVLTKPAASSAAKPASTSAAKGTLVDPFSAR